MLKIVNKFNAIDFSGRTSALGWAKSVSEFSKIVAKQTPGIQRGINYNQLFENRAKSWLICPSNQLEGDIEKQGFKCKCFDPADPAFIECKRRGQLRNNICAHHWRYPM